MLGTLELLESHTPHNTTHWNQMLCTQDRVYVRVQQLLETHTALEYYDMNDATAGNSGIRGLVLLTL